MMSAPQPITLSPVESSQICAMGHCPVTNVLAVQFFRKGEGGKRVPGSIYHYSGFTQSDWDKFNGAESKGAYFGAFIKSSPEKFPYTRQEPQKDEE